MEKDFLVNGNDVIKMLETFRDHYAPIVYKGATLKAVKDVIAAICKQVRQMGEDE
jgi:hypothetical protein